MFSGFSVKPVKPLISKVLAPPADELEIDPGVVELLKRPKAINPEDDHFNDAALNARWIPVSATYDMTTIPGWLGITGRIITPVPTGNWVIETEALIPTFTSAGFHICGLCLHDSATNTGTQAIWLFGMDNSVTASYFQFAKHINGVFSSQYFQVTAMQRMDYQFLRITKSGTNYACDYSSHSLGKRWSRLNNTSSLGFVPTHFGLYNGSGNKAYFNYFLRR